LVAEGALYDDIGRGYTGTRRQDPRIAQALWRALGDARSVLNVGAGAGAYEPAGRRLLAIEPSDTMIAQRPRDAAPVIKASAEDLPLPDRSFDVAMAVLSDHHWHDRRQALRELRRVARRRVVLFNADPALAELFWLSSEYLPEFFDLIPEPYRKSGVWRQELESELGPVELLPVPIPHDCRDGFYGAYWRRPDAYLNPRLRAGISVFARLPRLAVEGGRVIGMRVTRI
jgi:SAM-dependent methyltransferase